MNFNMNQLMQQAQKMQKELQKMKKDFEAKEFTYVSSDELLTIKISGAKKVTKIDIDPDLFANSDSEILADMIVVNINKALDVVDEEYESMMSNMGFDPRMLGGMV